MNHKIAIINRFLPPIDKNAFIVYRKSTILVFSHLFLLVASLCIFSYTWVLEKHFLWWLLIAPLFIIPSLFYFKKTGNLKIAGNFLAFISFILLVPSILTTGGLYSSFIPWLFVIPLSTVLVEDLLWSTTWLCIAGFSYVMLYFYGQAYPSINFKPSSDLYQLINYISVAGYAFLLLVLFEGSQVFTIKVLKNKNQELVEQQQLIKQSLKELELIELKLKESNSELQNFAFAASHDLKEPLRMIGMYTQLIQRRLNSSGDDNIKEYMAFVTDGVRRMQNLLDNLLSYSRLGKNVHDTKEVDLNGIFNIVKNNLTVAINESNTKVTCEPLPILTASITEMTQLFQNLISNSIKFRKADTQPVISINYIDNNHEHLFAVIDNGIGIKKEHLAKVFDIFTRLHSQSEYEGTGIGLATCKKIVNNLGGRIWLNSVEGEGTTFYFTIPKGDVIRLESRVGIHSSLKDIAA